MLRGGAAAGRTVAGGTEAGGACSPAVRVRLLKYCLWEQGINGAPWPTLVPVRIEFRWLEVLLQLVWLPRLECCPAGLLPHVPALRETPSPMFFVKSLTGFSRD